MAVYDTLQERTVAVKVYGMFDGIPNIFANWPIPSAWDAGSGTVTIGGETYTWDESLEMREGFGQVATRVNLKSGDITSGVSSVRFRLPGTARPSTGNVWLELLARSTQRLDVDHASLNDDFEIADSTMTVHSTTGWDTPTGVAYIGLETVDYTGTSGTTFTGCTRGRWRSPTLKHRGRVDGAHEIGSGTFVRSSPLAVKGRVFRLWLCFGEYVSGSFVPFGSTIESTDDLEWFRGIVVDRTISEDLMYLDVEMATLDQMFAREILTKNPEAFAGIYSDADSFDRFHLDEAWNQVSWTSFDSPTYGRALTRTLGKDDGAAGIEDVPVDAFYPFSLIAEYILFTINWYEAGTVTYDYVDVLIGRGEDGEMVTRLQVGADFGTTAERAFEINPTVVRSIWIPLGFESQQFETDDTLVTMKNWTFISERPPARFYMPDPIHGCPTRIYVSQPSYDGAPDFVAAPGWTDSDGAAVNGFVRIGKECFEFSSYDQGTNGTSYLTLVCRAALGSRGRENYVEASTTPGIEKREEALQGFVIPNTTVMNAFVQALTSGSGVADHNGEYDGVSWEGSGANVSDEHCDLDAFTRVARELDGTRYDAIATFKPVKLRSLMPAELAVSQTGVAGHNVYDPVAETWSGFLLQPFDPLHPLLHEIEDADTLDISEIVANASLLDEDADERAVNTILVDALFDHGRQKYDSPKTPINQVSFQESYGKNPALKLQIRSIFGYEEMTDRLRDILGPIFAEFGEPYRVLTIPIASFAAWGWGPGKILQLTHAGLIRRKAAGRGETSMAVKVMERTSVVYGPEQGAVFSSVTCIEAAFRSVGIAPSFEVLSLHSGSEYNIDPNRFRASETGLKDISDFVVGEYVRCFEEGQVETTSVVRLISGVDLPNDRVTFSGGLPFASCICEFPDYDNANTTSRQKNYSYICDDDLVLDISGGGTDLCHRYS